MILVLADHRGCDTRHLVLCRSLPQKKKKPCVYIYIFVSFNSFSAFAVKRDAIFDHCDSCMYTLSPARTLSYAYNWPQSSDVTSKHKSCSWKRVCLMLLCNSWFFFFFLFFIFFSFLLRFDSPANRIRSQVISQVWGRTHNVYHTKTRRILYADFLIISGNFRLFSIGDDETIAYRSIHAFCKCA